jgi:hypothetical protein
MRIFPQDPAFSLSFFTWRDVNGKERFRPIGSEQTNTVKFRRRLLPQGGTSPK